jgi:hypothetical protein
LTYTATPTCSRFLMETPALSMDQTPLANVQFERAN